MILKHDTYVLSDKGPTMGYNNLKDLARIFVKEYGNSKTNVIVGIDKVVVVMKNSRTGIDEVIVFTEKVEKK